METKGALYELVPIQHEKLTGADVQPSQCILFVQTGHRLQGMTIDSIELLQDSFYDRRLPVIIGVGLNMEDANLKTVIKDTSSHLACSRKVLWLACAKFEKIQFLGAETNATIETRPDALVLKRDWGFFHAQLFESMSDEKLRSAFAKEFIEFQALCGAFSRPAFIYFLCREHGGVEKLLYAVDTHSTVPNEMLKKIDAAFGTSSIDDTWEVVVGLMRIPPGLDPASFLGVVQRITDYFRSLLPGPFRALRSIFRFFSERIANNHGFN